MSAAGENLLTTDYWLLSTVFRHLKFTYERFGKRHQDIHELRAPLRGEVHARPHGRVAHAHRPRAAQAGAGEVERRKTYGRVARSRDRAHKLLRHLAPDRPRAPLARRRARGRGHARPAPHGS